MRRKTKTLHTVDEVVEENIAKKAKEPKRNEKLTKEMMYGNKAYKRTVRDTQGERDLRGAYLHSFGGEGRVSIEWDLNAEGIRDQIFRINVGDKTAFLSATEIQKYLRWV